MKEFERTDDDGDAALNQSESKTETLWKMIDIELIAKFDKIQGSCPKAASLRYSVYGASLRLRFVMHRKLSFLLHPPCLYFAKLR